MKWITRMATLIISISLMGISSVQALDETKVRITLSNDLPPISDSLAIYVREIDTETDLTGPGNPIGTDRTVGFNQTNIGGGPSEGNNEKIPFSFVFPCHPQLLYLPAVKGFPRRRPHDGMAHPALDIRP